MSSSLVSRKLWAALVVAGMLLMLAACGVASTGGGSTASPVQAIASTMSTLPPSPVTATAAPPPTPVAETAESTTTATTANSQGEPVKAQTSLIDALRKARATVAVGDTVEQPFLSTSGT